jgi:AAA15 family ATPase/GTPase
MLDSLYIKNFRLFKELTIEKLGRINLIVGQNNSGKTCLLEALHLYAKNASPRTLYELIMERGEDWEIRRQQENNESSTEEIENPLRHLFYGYHFPELGDSRDIEIGSFKEHNERLKLHIHAYQTIETEDTRRFTRVDEKQTQFFDEETELVIEIEIAHKIKSRIRLNEIETPKKYQTRHYFPYRLSSNEAKLNVQVVPTKHINDDKVATLWDNINVQPFLRKAVFKGVQLIDKNIQEVVLVGRGRDTTPILIYEDNDDKIPLKSLGDGMTHLFHIILALVNAKDGFLLIDEFENGLHYTVQSKVWALIFKLAKELNVQVFATTHSWDCVTTFIETTQANETEAWLFNLGRSALKSNENQIIATAYDKDELELVTQADLEVR